MIKKGCFGMQENLWHKMQTITEVLDHRSQTDAKKLAFIYLNSSLAESNSLTYGQLAERAKTIACYLQQFDIKGKTVLLLYPPGLDFICAFFGCFYAGAIAVPAY